MKRILSFLTVCALLVSMIPALPVHAHETTLLDRVILSEDGTTATFQERGDVHVYLCDMLVKRVPSFAIRLPIDQYYDSIMEGLYNAALRHSNGDHKCGDSVRWQAVPMDWNLEIEEGYVTLYYSFAYLTTAQEEEALDAALDDLVAQLACDPERKYDTVKTVYDWVCTNVSYVDGENATLHDYTPYGALINRTATGQGFALLMYQILRKLELSCYVVPGTLSGAFHSWNVVSIDSDYYNIDAALDAGKTEYAWFLKSDAENLDHQRDPACDEWFVPHGDQTYVSPAEICREQGHYWCDGNTCLDHDYCQRCGQLSEEYGDHTNSIARDHCDDPYVCHHCMQIVVESHTYDDITDTSCNRCDHYRRIICSEDTVTLRYMVSDASEEPEIYAPPGVSVTLTEEENGVHLYTLKFPETGSYMTEVKWSNGRETESFDVLVADHNYSQSDGICTRCGKDSGTVHVHTWIPQTCYTPETCSECGETRGVPKPHYFYNKNCTTQPSVCEDCGYVTDGPPGHVYHSSYDSHCLKCDQLRIFGCTKAGAMWSWFSSFPEGYRIVEAEPGVTLEIVKQWEDNGKYGWTYTVLADRTGQFEVTLEEIGTGERTTITANLNPHTYSETDGICYYCEERDPDRHFHDWADATCTEPRTCTGCGATEGYAEGHWFSNDPCTGPKTCNRCGLVREAPSHFYGDTPNATCTLCGQRKITVCEGTGVPLLLSSSEGGDFTLDNPNSGCTLVYLEYFVAKGVYYWESIIYTPGPGLYELPMSQKNSDEPFGVTLNVVPHEFVDGICRLCGGVEDAGHIHTWKSATCTQPAICTECGEKEGSPLNHDFSQYVCSEYAKCARCKESRGKVHHVYDSNSDDYCNVCNRFRIHGCQDDEFFIALESEESAGFRLSGAPSGVYIEEAGYYLGRQIKYQIFTPKPGVYELTMKDKVTGEAFHFTLERGYHNYVNGACEHCGKKDKSVHSHWWIEATCEEPAVCIGCDETKGEPLGHNWREATCNTASHCYRCGMQNGDPLGHDFVAWSCQEPAVCSRCNVMQEFPAGHVYDGHGDSDCNRCGRVRVLGCPEGELTVSLTSAVEDPYILLHPAKGVAMSHVETVASDGGYTHTYRFTVGKPGKYEVTLWQQGMPEYAYVTLEVTDHLYENGVCGFCGAEFAGLMGDVDGNGKLTYNDALIVLRASIKLTELTAQQEALADFDGNGKLDYNDALKILRASIGLN